MSFGSLLEEAMAGTQRRDAVESRFLRSASYEGLRRLAGRPPDPVENILPVEACVAETRPSIPAAAAGRLVRVLTDRPGLLGEWLGLAAAGKWRLAHDCLPDVLNYARLHPDVHDLVLEVGGERLFWLAALNPDWHFAAHVEPEAQFAAGGPDERVHALRQIRRHDAARGRELLQAVVDGRSDRSETRSALLGTLADGLSTEDEPLLMQAIQDARKDVRDRGLRLIRRIPDSRFGQRWSERAQQLVIIVESPLGATIEVHEPDTPDPAWVLDGLDPRPPKGIGATAWALQQVLALTPPSIWPPAALHAMERSDWSQPLLSGLGQAAVAYADAGWSERLLVAGANADVVRGVHWAALLGALAPDRAEAVVRQLLDSGTHGVVALAASLRHPWSESFSREILARLPALLRKQQYATSPLLHEAGMRLDPHVLPEAKVLDENYPEPAWGHSAFERMVRTLEFRLAMRAELEPA